MTKENLTVMAGLTAERLREIMDYWPDTGVLMWKATFNGTSKLGPKLKHGVPLGCADKHGHLKQKSRPLSAW